MSKLSATQIVVLRAMHNGAHPIVWEGFRSRFVVDDIPVARSTRTLLLDMGLIQRRMIDAREWADACMLTATGTAVAIEAIGQPPKLSPTLRKALTHLRDNRSSWHATELRVLGLAARQDGIWSLTDAGKKLASEIAS